VSGLVLDLCGGTGSWSKPYADAGYDVRVIDPQAIAESGVSVAEDVRAYRAPSHVHGILAAPPCTHFSVSGAQHWGGKDADGRTLDHLTIVMACLRIIAEARPAWWALENPIGRLRGWLGAPAMSFDPCDFGDPYTKRTQLWGRFRLPFFSPCDPTDGSRMHLISPGPERARIRSQTPPGFAKAFFEANP